MYTEAISFVLVWPRVYCVTTIYDEVLHTVIMMYFASSLQGGWTALINASIRGHTEVVRLLLQSQADVNAQDEVMCLSISGCAKLL